METWLLLALILLITIYFLRPRPVPASIQSIIIYPVRSCAGIRLPQANIVSTGLAFDRIWTFVDSDGLQVTAKADPRLWRVQPTLDLSAAEVREMVLTYEGKRLKVDLGKPVEGTLTMRMAEGTVEVGDAGAEAAAWAREALGKDYRLCKMLKPGFSQEAPDTLVTFPDMRAHMLFASNESLYTLIRSVPEPKKTQLAMSCFRPNIVLEGCAAWAEDSWHTMRIGDLTFTAAGPCDRCRMTTIDPRTLAFDEKTEPLPTLRKIHGKDVKAFFGQFFNRNKDGVISVGDQVQILSTKSFPN